MTSNSQPEEPRAAVAPPPLSATPVLDPEHAAIVAARDSMHLDDCTRGISDMMLDIAQPLRGRGLSLQALMAHGCVGLVAASENRGWGWGCDRTAGRPVPSVPLPGFRVFRGLVQCPMGTRQTTGSCCPAVTAGFSASYLALSEQSL